MNWLVNGAMAGAAIGLGAVAIIGTGGLAAAAIVGGLTAGGAGLGEMLSTMSWAPKEVCGVIKGACSGNVFTNGLPAARAHVDVVDCFKHSPPYPPIATGSATVFINGQPAARVDDITGCSAVISSGSNNVFIGGGTVQTDAIEPEKLVPDGVHAALFVVGVGSAIVLGGPIIATAGLIGGAAGQLGGEWLGGKAFGIGSDGQKWAMLGGALLGGAVGAKGGAGLTGKLSSRPLLKAQKSVEGRPYETNNVEMKSGGDRLIGTMGPARINNAAEYNAILTDLKAKGVDISYRDGQFAYGPAPSGGRPGNIVFDPDSSLSAIKHEYGHFLDDAALGFPGQRYYYENPAARLATERRQYLGEIRTARKLGDTTARRQLIEDYRGEKIYLIENYYPKPYGSQ
jgi:uncharacterized Zn-binding protein involved in type VI secretion